jgi:hypothetical protein
VAYGDIQPYDIRIPPLKKIRLSCISFNIKVNWLAQDSQFYQQLSYLYHVNHEELRKQLNKTLGKIISANPPNLISYMK